MGAYFPLFVDVSEKKILVIGAGAIAARRLETLCSFAKNVTVIAPKASALVEQMAFLGSIQYLPRAYREGEITEDTDLVLAATDSQQVNQAIWRECKEKKILVNVCSDKELCDFYFPGIVKRENLVVGVTASGRDHGLARRMTERIRQVIENEGIR